jgi:hypothetical protein
MKLYNNTQNEILYTISAGQSDSCGTISPGDTADEDAYNNTNNVTVYFSNNDNSYPFSVTIPNTGEGMAVTVGIYFE